MFLSIKKLKVYTHKVYEKCRNTKTDLHHGKKLTIYKDYKIFRK